MITKPHDNQIMSRFSLAAALQQSAHYFDMKNVKDEKEKGLNTMLSQLLVEASVSLQTLGLQELKLLEKEG